MEVSKASEEGPSKITQTFSFIDKTDDSLEPSQHEPEDRDHNSNNVEKYIKVITIERPTPKLIYEEPSIPLRTRVRDVASFLRSNCQKTYQQIKAFLYKQVWPLLRPFQFLIEVILCNLIMLISSPVILVWYILLLLVRQGVTLYLNVRYKGKYKLMCGADAAWGIQWYANDNCFMSLYILEGECSIDKIRDRMKKAVIDKIESTTENSIKFTYDQMRSKIAQKCGFFCWEKHPNFQIADHVKFVKNDPSAEMTDEDVFNEIRTFVDHPLPQDLPQWELLVVPKFIYKNGSSEDNDLNYDASNNKSSNLSLSHYALIWRINHSIMDGISAVSALGQCIADKPVKMTVDPCTKRRIPWHFKVFLYLQMFVLGPRSFIKTMIKKDSNCFHGPTLSGPKTVIWSRPLSIQTLKIIKERLHTSTTAVLLSALGSSLKNLAERKNLPVPSKIIGGATCAVLPYPNYGPQNRFTVASFSLKLDINCPRERLESATKSVEVIASGSEIVKNFNMIRVAGLNPVAWIAKLMNNLQATFLMSNVPGPAEMYTMFGGDKLVDVTAWNTIKGTTAIGVCLFSYAGKLRAGVMVDSAVLPNPADVPAMVQDFELGVVELARISGLPEESVFKKDI